MENLVNCCCFVGVDPEDRTCEACGETLLGLDMDTACGPMTVCFSRTDTLELAFAVMHGLREAAEEAALELVSRDIASKDMN